MSCICNQRGTHSFLSGGCTAAAGEASYRRRDPPSRLKGTLSFFPGDFRQGRSLKEGLCTTTEERGAGPTEVPPRYFLEQKTLALSTKRGAGCLCHFLFFCFLQILNNRQASHFILWLVPSLSTFVKKVGFARRPDTPGRPWLAVPRVCICGSCYVRCCAASCLRSTLWHGHFFPRQSSPIDLAMAEAGESSMIRTYSKPIQSPPTSISCRGPGHTDGSPPPQVQA